MKNPAAPARGSRQFARELTADCAVGAENHLHWPLPDGRRATKADLVVAYGFDQVRRRAPMTVGARYAEGVAPDSMYAAPTTSMSELPGIHVSAKHDRGGGPYVVPWK